MSHISKKLSNIFTKKNLCKVDLYSSNQFLFKGKLYIVKIFLGKLATSSILSLISNHELAFSRMETCFDNCISQKNITDLRSATFLRPYNNRVPIKIRIDFTFLGKSFSPQIGVLSTSLVSRTSSFYILKL